MPRELVKLKIHRCKGKWAGPKPAVAVWLVQGSEVLRSQSCVKVSVDTFSNSYLMPDQVLKPLSWAVSSKLMCVSSSREGQGFVPPMALEVPCWGLLTGRLLGSFLVTVPYASFLAGVRNGPTILGTSAATQGKQVLVLLTSAHVGTGWTSLTKTIAIL